VSSSPSASRSAFSHLSAKDEDASNSDNNSASAASLLSVYPPFTSNTSVSTASTALSNYRSLHASTISSDAANSAYWNERATELLTWDHYPYGPADLV
jgi:hypothetical protein